MAAVKQNGVDLDGTYSPVVKISTLRFLFVLAVRRDLEKNFPMKDLSVAKFCLGVKVTQRPEDEVIVRIQAKLSETFQKRLRPK